jgi:DNA adenine methylase
MIYVGGKNRIGKDISLKMKELIDSGKVSGYMEPFCGSLGVMKYMVDYHDNLIAADSHCDLIALWKGVKNGTFDPPKTVTEKYYNEVKKMKSPSALKGFVGFGCSFGGKYFGGYGQKYVKNHPTNFLRGATNSIIKLKPLLKKIKFSCNDYKKFTPVNMLIYCDPPYKNSRGGSLYRKKTKQYDNFNNKEFWDTMRKWSKNNYVFISELEAPPDFKSVWQKKKQISISQSKLTRYKVSPKLKKTQKKSQKKTKRISKKYAIEKLFTLKT